VSIPTSTYNFWKVGAKYGCYLCLSLASDERNIIQEVRLSSFLLFQRIKRNEGGKEKEGRNLEPRLKAK
jgi:hypothetical protein